MSKQLEYSKTALLETILFLPKTMEIPFLQYHQRRMTFSQLQLHNIFARIDLEKKILEEWQKQQNETLVNAEKIRCRVIYEIDIERIEFYPYKIQILENLTIVEEKDLNYQLKFANRDALNQLKNNFSTSDILITQNNLVTDISYANVAFFDGKKWITPEKPLLKGTKRVFLLEKKHIFTANINILDLIHFEKIWIFNAMMETKYSMTCKNEILNLAILKEN